MTSKELQVTQKHEIEKSHGELTYAGRMYVPQVDIYEDDNTLTLKADVPGTKSETVDVDLRDGVLTLTCRGTEIAGNWRPLYREHDVGGYTRRFTVGERIAQDKISASLENGVLTVVLPKAEQHRPRRIEVR